MDRMNKYRIGTQSIEDWLEVFEVRADSTGIVRLTKKVKMCKSVIGF